MVSARADFAGFGAAFLGDYKFRVRRPTIARLRTDNMISPRAGAHSCISSADRRQRDSFWKDLWSELLGNPVGPDLHRSGIPDAIARSLHLAESGSADPASPPPNIARPMPARPSWLDRNQGKWWFRYPCAAACVAIGISLINDGSRPPWGGLLLFGFAALLAYEMLLLGLAAAAVWWLGGAIAGLPVSAAIILGAVIIASAVRRN